VRFICEAGQGGPKRPPDPGQLIPDPPDNLIRVKPGEEADLFDHLSDRPVRGLRIPQI
jgi:hypothetical protein